jgi:ABC-type branched-subunit amino acid transport system substrate-binding protein
VLQRVYASLPLSGPSAVAGRELLLGIEIAHRVRNLVELVVLDSYGSDREERARANAATAADDGQALAYIGDFHSSQVLETAPILGEAGLLGIAAVATFVGLAGSTLVRLMPNDEAGARAIAAWLDDKGAHSALVIHDHDEGYGNPVGAMVADAATARGLAVRVQPVWDDPPERADLVGAEAFVYAGVAGPSIASYWEALYELDPALRLIGTEGIAVPQLARELSPAAAARTRLFVANRAPFAFYGFEAMALALDAIAEGSGDREAVARAGRATRDRESPFGSYSLDENGLTKTTEYGRLAVVERQLVWDLT